jgi:hypothetical protein
MSDVQEREGRLKGCEVRRERERGEGVPPVPQLLSSRSLDFSRSYVLHSQKEVD